MERKRARRGGHHVERVQRAETRVGGQREMHGETEAFAPSWTIRHPDALAAGGSFSGYVILRAASYPTSGWDISHGTFQPHCIFVCPTPIKHCAAQRGKQHVYPATPKLPSRGEGGSPHGANSRIRRTHPAPLTCGDTRLSSSRNNPHARGKSRWRPIRRRELI